MYTFWICFYLKQLSIILYILLGDAFPENRTHDFTVANDMIYRNFSPINYI